MGNFLSREEQLEFMETQSMRNSSDEIKRNINAPDAVENGKAPIEELKVESKVPENPFDLEAIKPPLMHPFLFIEDICIMFNIERP
ncbi:14819_t:CDS:1, partial [Acaulospora colombiana]